jgi:hypothetical protein
MFKKLALTMIAAFCMNVFADVKIEDPVKPCAAQGWNNANDIIEISCAARGLREIQADHNGACIDDPSRVSCIKCVALDSNLCPRQPRERKLDPAIDQIIQQLPRPSIPDRSNQPTVK